MSPYPHPIIAREGWPFVAIALAATVVLAWLFGTVGGLVGLAALAGVPEVLVLDRNYSPGHGGVLHQELRAALYGMPGAPRIHGYLAGVGGVNVSPSKITEFVRMASGSEPQPHSMWVE